MFTEAARSRMTRNRGLYRNVVLIVRRHGTVTDGAEVRTRLYFYMPMLYPTLGDLYTSLSPRARRRYDRATAVSSDCSTEISLQR
jgi:hypothetical protein